MNQGNGRKGRATKALFDNPTGREVYAWMKDIVDRGLAVTNPDEGGSVYDNLLGIGNGTHVMTIETSASLGTITDVLGSGAYPNVDARCRSDAGTERQRWS